MIVMHKLEVENVFYTYKSKYQRVNALSGVNCVFDSGKFYAITGRSGSGKTTLLALMGGLDQPTAGRLLFEGREYASMDLDLFRRRDIGMIFQNYQLFSYLTVEENIMYSVRLNGVSKKEALKSVGKWLSAVGLGESCRKKFPTALSGGEQQRVAIARALASGARVILADEPTGNLDSENSANIIRILQDLVRKEDYCVILVTHDQDIADQADRTYHILDGIIK